MIADELRIKQRVREQVAAVEGLYAAREAKLRAELEDMRRRLEQAGRIAHAAMVLHGAGFEAATNSIYYVDGPAFRALDEALRTEDP